jgi:asparagine synthase (glutamine-hydrolysing)
MCGFGGQISDYISFNKSKEVLNRLSHRGPDALASWHQKSVQLFHTRLSILDLDKRANQPFFDSSGRYLIIYNGELYNYRQLKSRIGVHLRTTCDTEVLVELLKNTGVADLSSLEGMFAFAFYDTQTETCLLARDRFGKKPLYYHHSDKGFYFASEVRALLAMLPELAFTDKSSISNLLHWQTIPGLSTLLPEFKQVEPGTYLIYNKGKLEVNSYVKWQSYAVTETSEKLVLPRVKSLVTKAVNKRLISDVPFAVFLSGGVDSSIITALAAKEIGSSLNTFTVSFDETEFSEHHIASIVAKRYNTRHHEIRVTPKDFLLEIEAGLAATDHPSGDGLNTYVISKRTRNAGFKMALSGIGGDEWFLGYQYFRALDFWKKCHFLKSVRTFSKYIPLKFRKSAELIQAAAVLGAAAYPYQRVLFDSYTIQNWLGLPAPSIFPNQPVFPDTMSARSVQEWYYYNQPVLLRDTDQFSMAVGLELRAPLMDQNLVAFALSLPDSIKLGKRPKHLLVEAFKDLLPSEVYSRKKQGFTLPWECWLRAELREFCYARLQAFEKRIDTRNILPEWERFLKGKQTFSWSRWWSMVALEDYLSRNGITVRA